MPIILLAGLVIVGSQLFAATHGAKILSAGAAYALKQRKKGYKVEESIFTDRHVDGGMLISTTSEDKLGQCLGGLSESVPELKEFSGKRLDLTKTEAALLAKMLGPVLTSYGKAIEAMTVEERDEYASHYREALSPVIMYLQEFPKARMS